MLLRSSPASTLLAPIQRHRRTYLVMNAVFFGLVLLGMLIAAAQPSLQQSMLDQVRHALQRGLMESVADAYHNHHLFKAIILTFLINLILGSVLQLQIPSMIVPFFGLLFVSFRAISWGILFSPFTGHYGPEIIPHYLTTILEGEGYVLAALAVYVQSAWVLPRVWSRSAAYRDGVIESFQIYKLVTIVLAVAAVYEACEVIYLAPLLKHA